jgi:myo-inositol-1(or 4)-monophosphatase
MIDPEGLLRIAMDAAEEAGRLLASWRGDVRPEVVDTKSSPTDVVTEMDRKAEAVIAGRIRAARPGDAILGEEGGQIEPQGSGAEVRWVVDPLDGTVNYLYGLRDWAVSVAAEVDGAIVAGVVEVPRFGETFTAVAGGGAWLHRGGHRTDQRPAAAPGRVGAAGPDSPVGAAGPDSPVGAAGPDNRAVPLRCTSVGTLGQALVATGFGYSSERRRVQGEVVAAVLPQVRDIRRGGSAAVDLCSVAAGRVDAFYERGLNYWDYAAGGLIAREAGAMVGGLAGKSASTSMLLAAGPVLYPHLDRLLASLDPERGLAETGEGPRLRVVVSVLLLVAAPKCTVPRRAIWEYLRSPRRSSASRMCAGRERDRIPRRNRAQLRPRKRYNRAATRVLRMKGDGVPDGNRLRQPAEDGRRPDGRQPAGTSGSPDGQVIKHDRS